MENAIANGKGQNYWSLKTFIDGDYSGEYDKNNSSSQEFIDAIFDIHHPQSTIGNILSYFKESDFIVTKIGEQITITTTDFPEGVDSEITLIFVENELIRSYEISSNEYKFKAIFTYELQS